MQRHLNQPAGCHINLVGDSNFRVPLRFDLSAVLKRGAVLWSIRSSWGSQWGDNGHGWLPINYVRNQLAKDFWSLVSEQWLDSEDLSQPSVIADKDLGSR